MKKVITLAICSTLGLFSFFTQAQELTHGNMQHYSFSYNFQQTVDPIQHQYSETSQELDYLLVLDIQRQTNSTLEPMRVKQNLPADNLRATELVAAE